MSIINGNPPKIQTQVTPVDKGVIFLVEDDDIHWSVLISIAADHGM